MLLVSCLVHVDYIASCIRDGMVLLLLLLMMMVLDFIAILPGGGCVVLGVHCGVAAVGHLVAVVV